MWFGWLKGSIVKGSWVLWRSWILMTKETHPTPPLLYINILLSCFSLLDSKKVQNDTGKSTRRARKMQASFQNDCMIPFKELLTWLLMDSDATSKGLICRFRQMASCSELEVARKVDEHLCARLANGKRCSISNKATKLCKGFEVHWTSPNYQECRMIHWARKTL